MDAEGLLSALDALGRLLEQRAQRYRLAVVGGGALLLGGFIDRPTEDLDVVAQVDGLQLVSAQPLSPPLVNAVTDIATAAPTASTSLT